MTDAVIALILLIGVLKAITQPWIGILLWTWISIMNPHRLGWRVANWPVAAVAGGVTLLALVISKDRRNPFCSASVITLLLFMIWMTITLPMSMYYDASFNMWNRVMKIDFMVIVALALIYSRKHIIALVAVVAFSLGFYGVKGGIFTVATGGGYRVWGPADSFIEGNNEIALALIMIIPLVLFLRTLLTKGWQKHAMVLAALLCAAAALGSQSRGALVAIAAMSVVLWARSKNKAVIGIVMVLVGVSLVAFMPDSWTERMNTIETYEEDASAMGRINAWWMAWNLAKDNFFGGGYSIYWLPVFAMYAPDPLDVHAAHSIYFQVLGEHGFIGLFLFLLIWLLVWRDAAWLRKNGVLHPQSEWAATLGAMCQVSLVGYAIGGAFLSLAYFDLPYNILIIAAAARRWVTTRAWETETVTDAAVPVNSLPQTP